MQDEITNFYFYNNGYNEQDAINRAISMSLGEEMVPPSQRHNLAEFANYENPQTDQVTKKISQVLDMVKNTRAKINELINLDLSSNSQKKQSKKETNLSETQKIIRNQDAEYQEALKIAQEKEKEKEEEANKKGEKEVNKMSNYTEMIKQKLKEIGEEPKNGIVLAISLPNGHKMKRVFSQKCLGNDVYIWAASNEQIISSGFKIGKFSLIFGTDIVLNGKKSLYEQKIDSKTIFSIIDNQ